MTVGGSLLGTLPSWLDVDFVRTASGALSIVALVVLVAVIFMIRSMGTRLVVVVMLGAAVFGLLHYRQSLDHCDERGCACKFFGEKLEGGGCAR